MREQRKVVTVLFCDLVGSTALGESTDPEALRARMQRYFEDLRRIVERHGGTVEKFVGDAVMAVFGIPTAHEDDALRAVRAALEMRASIATHGLEARIGVNSGEVFVGGGGETLVTGDAVNVAARLEQAAGPGETLIGAETRLLVRHAVRVEAARSLELKGKADPVEAYLLLDVIGDEPVARHLDRPLVGRARERQRLWRDYEDAVADRACRLFTLLGPAGIGKSRLVADFLARVGDSADVLRGRCLSYGEGITYWPLVEMLGSIGIQPESIVASTPEETRVAFRRLLEARAVERPQVVVVEDLQWAEPVFVDLVEHVADLSRSAPVFLLCIARTELLEVRPGWGGGKLNATSLLLEPLGDEDCAELMAQLVPDASLDDALRERIAAASAGNPLFVEEMLAMARDRTSEDLVVPPTIQALLQARIDSLDSDVRVVLEHGAVEGEVFHRGAVAALVSDELRSGLEEHLASLVRKELIRSVGGLFPGGDAFRFRHALIRDAAYGAMPKELRAQLHERFAGWLERTSPDSAFEWDEILGYHLEQAYRLRSELGRTGGEVQELAARAGLRLLAAGRRALGRTDLPAAAVLLQRGVDLFPGNDPRRLEALPELALAVARAGDLGRSNATLRIAIEGARATGNEVVEARARLLASALRARVDPAYSVEKTLREALELTASLERIGDVPTLSRAWSEIGLSRFMLGRAAQGEADLEKAADLAHRAGDVSAERRALSARLRPLAYGPRSVVDGLAYCEGLLDLKIANADLRRHALQVRALLAAMHGDAELTRASSSEAVDLIEEYGLALSRGSYAGDVGFAFVVLGDLDAAESHLRIGTELFARMGETGNRATVSAQLADVLARQGRYEEAERRAEESRTIASPDDLDAQGRWRSALARVLVSRDEHDEAVRLVREAIALLEPTDFVVLRAEAHDLLGELLAGVGRTDDAAVAVVRAIALHEQKGNVVSAARSRAMLGRLAPS